MLTWSTAGESHGPTLIAMMEGMPSGVPVTTDDLRDALAERRLGYGRGARQKFEKDEVRIVSGVRHGFTTGAPICVEIQNSEWSKWEVVMSADPVSKQALSVDAGKGDHREMARNRPLTTPRPGHADLAGLLSYNLKDARDVLERASARETAARVVLGKLASQFLRTVSDIKVVGHVVAVGDEEGGLGLPRPEQIDALRASELRTLDEEAETRFREAIDDAQADGDTVGGVVEVVAWNVPVGLGTHVDESGKLDARLAAALMAIQSVKAVEVGDGFVQAASRGSTAHDEMRRTDSGLITRTSNQAGGIEGGTSNGQPIVLRAAFKPISTIPKALKTVDLAAGMPATAFHQRSDTCQVVPGAVIVEAQVYLQLAKAFTERFGGRSVEEVRAGINWFTTHVRSLLEGGL